MIEILHYLKDPKLWNYGIFLLLGTAGVISPTVPWKLIRVSWYMASGSGYAYRCLENYEHSSQSDFFHMPQNPSNIKAPTLGSERH